WRSWSDMETANGPATIASAVRTRSTMISATPRLSTFTVISVTSLPIIPAASRPPASPHCAGEIHFDDDLTRAGVPEEELSLLRGLSAFAEGDAPALHPVPVGHGVIHRRRSLRGRPSRLLDLCTEHDPQRGLVEPGIEPPAALEMDHLLPAEEPLSRPDRVAERLHQAVEPDLIDVAAE